MVSVMGRTAEPCPGMVLLSTSIFGDCAASDDDEASISLSDGFIPTDRKARCQKLWVFGGWCKGKKLDEGCRFVRSDRV